MSSYQINPLTGLPDLLGGGSSGLGTMSTQNANAVAITGGTIGGLTSFGVRSTASAFDLIIGNASTLTANRTLLFNTGDSDRTVLFAGAAGTIQFNGVGTVAYRDVVQTFNLAQTFSASGAASTAGLRVSGSPFTTGTAVTTKPLVWIENTSTASSAWTATGTMLGINSPSTFAGALFDAQLNGKSIFKVLANGSINLASTVNRIATMFSSDINSGTFEIRPTAGNSGLWVANVFTSNNTFEFLDMGWTSSVAHLWTTKGSVGGSARDLYFGRDSTPMVMLTSGKVSVASGINFQIGNAYTADPLYTADGYMVMYDSNGVAYKVGASAL